MRLLFISDIHGISINLDYIDNQFNKLKCDQLVVLGDLYYNYSSIDSDIESVQAFLYKHKNHLICIKGNCDSNIDIKLSNFTIYDNKELVIDNWKLYLTHGHIYNVNNLPNMRDNSILIYGHEHKPFILFKHNYYILNPGSISLPRNTEKATYMIYDNNMFIIYDLQGNIIYQLNLKKALIK